MHWSGKFVFTWLLVLGALLATIFTGQLFTVRNGWQDKMGNLRILYDRDAAELKARKKELRELISELQREERGWGDEWDNGTFSPNTMAMTFPVATRLSVGDIVFAFAPLNDPQKPGEMIYIGEFEISDARPPTVALKPRWRIRPLEEVENWPAGPGWRLRAFVPAKTRQLFSDYEEHLVELDVQQADEVYNLQRQELNRTRATLQLNQRIAELQGSPEMLAKKGQLPPEDVEGLVAAIEQVEELRNVLMNDVDDLRRKIYHATEEYKDLTIKNRQLADQLPQPPKPITAKTGSE